MPIIRHSIFSFCCFKTQLKKIVDYYQVTERGRQEASVIPPATGSSRINLSTTERWMSAAGGALTLVYALNRKTGMGRWTMALSGVYMLLRGATGYCAVNKAVGREAVERKARVAEASATFTINKPRHEVYTFWRRLENLPVFMKNLKEVTQLDATQSQWKAGIPGGLGTISWKATIVDDRPDECISWISLPGSAIDNAGEVDFKEAPGNQGTEVKLRFAYRLPAGALGSIAAPLVNPLFEQLLIEELRSFKSLMETGEMPTIEGQPSGRKADRKKAEQVIRNYQAAEHESTLLERR